MYVGKGFDINHDGQNDLFVFSNFSPGTGCILVLFVALFLITLPIVSCYEQGERKRRMAEEKNAAIVSAKNAFLEMEGACRSQLNDPRAEVSKLLKMLGENEQKYGLPFTPWKEVATDTFNKWNGLHRPDRRRVELGLTQLRKAMMTDQEYTSATRDRIDSTKRQIMERISYDRIAKLSNASVGDVRGELDSLIKELATLAERLGRPFDAWLGDAEAVRRSWGESDVPDLGLVETGIGTLRQKWRGGSPSR